MGAMYTNRRNTINKLVEKQIPTVRPLRNAFVRGPLLSIKHKNIANIEVAIPIPNPAMPGHWTEMSVRGSCSGADGTLRGAVGDVGLTEKHTECPTPRFGADMDGYFTCLLSVISNVCSSLIHGNDVKLFKGDTLRSFHSDGRGQDVVRSIELGCTTSQR